MSKSYNNIIHHQYWYSGPFHSYRCMYMLNSNNLILMHTTDITASLSQTLSSTIKKMTCILYNNDNADWQGMTLWYVIWVEQLWVSQSHAVLMSAAAVVVRGWCHCSITLHQTRKEWPVDHVTHTRTTKEVILWMYTGWVGLVKGRYNYIHRRPGNSTCPLPQIYNNAE